MIINAPLLTLLFDKRGVYVWQLLPGDALEHYLSFRRFDLFLYNFLVKNINNYKFTQHSFKKYFTVRALFSDYILQFSAYAWFMTFITVL